MCMLWFGPHRLRIRTDRPSQVAGGLLAAGTVMGIELVDHETFAGRAQTHIEQTLAEAYALYQRRLLQANALDFDDLIAHVVNIFRAFPAVADPPTGDLQVATLVRRRRAVEPFSDTGCLCERRGRGGPIPRC